MKDLSRRADAVPKSGIREIMALAAEMDHIVHLEVGEPSFDTPEHIISGACAGARDGFTRYTANAGLTTLREIIASHYTSKWDQTVRSEQILVTAGGVNALMATALALLDPGDEVLISDPGFPNYLSVVAVADGISRRYPTRAEQGFLPDPEEVDSRITPKTKILVLNSPSNPTGAVYPGELIQSLMEIARKHDLYVISDEIYEELVFDAEPHVPAARFDLDGRVITISGCSKTFAMTGWRLGYAIAKPNVVEVASKMMEPLVSCAPAISQKAAETAFTGPWDAVEEMRRTYQRRRDLAMEILEPAGLLPAIPKGAFYALVDLRSTGLSGQEAALGLLEEQRVAAAPGETFGEISSGMVRISLASSDEEVRTGCTRIVEFAQKHAN